MKRSSLFPAPARWLWAMPNLSLICFMAVGVALLWFIRTSEREVQHDTLVEDVLWQERALQTQLKTRQNQLDTMARDYASGQLKEQGFHEAAATMLRGNSEVLAVAFTNEYGDSVWSHPHDAINTIEFVPAALEPIQRAARIGLPAETPPFDYPGSGSVIALAEPVVSGNRTLGAFVAIISLHNLLHDYVPWWIARRYQVSFIDIDGQRVANRQEQDNVDSPLTHEVEFGGLGSSLHLRATTYRTGWPFWKHALYWVLGGLSALMMWSLWTLKRHMHERLMAERALTREMGMRRAMEDSLVSGICAMDTTGRTLHVHRAFCRMVDLGAEHLLGRLPPQPYWPPEAALRCEQVFAAILRGECPVNGFSLRFQRSNGERFDVRLYASPLIDGEGRHAGWVSSMYDITELRREREALKASHERFVTVLNGLDAAVAVVDRESNELLLSNLAFREAFQLGQPEGPCCALPLRTTDAYGEWLDPVGGRWYQHHRRSTSWVDQSQVWLYIATDVTERKQAGEWERQQTEKLQQTARLVAMGEIASSLAHELNQPLAAISSYSTACRNLVEAGLIGEAELDSALDKISEQARRAGAIIRGIREFVQRREPKRSACRVGDMVDTALALLTAPLNRNYVCLITQREADEVVLDADRVMLEQVLFNLCKNAIEAMADIPPGRRELTLETRCREGWLDIIVSDRGPGIAPDHLEKLFMPFFTTKAEGMGMGLNICRTIVEHHQGRLRVEANEGGGSRFVVSLPLMKKTLTEKVETHAV
ncbi:MAG: PAS domain S-box protein [Burkholderiales bacterium]|nr:PAS domain S-box protein [Burkholderiales bacterium]